MESFNDIQYRIEKGVLVLQVPVRDFVIEQSQTIVELVFEKLDDGPQDIVLDMSDVHYINSSGISVVIRLNLERNLCLVNPTGMVKDILELTGVLPFVPTCATVEDAIAGFCTDM